MTRETSLVSEMDDEFSSQGEYETMMQNEDDNLDADFLCAVNFDPYKANSSHEGLLLQANNN